MAIRRKCREQCGNGRRCLEHLWFDVMFRGTRYRMPANDFAVPRMDVGRQRPIESMEAARDWERLFIGEIKAGRDPRPKPTIKRAETANPQLVAGFLDLYFERQVKPADLRSVETIQSRIKILKQHFGDRRVKDLEDPELLNGFKTSSKYAKKVEVATLHKLLATLRAAIHWGQAQTPPLIDKSPFHRFGVRMSKKHETMRDRRISREEERRLLAAADAMNTWQHRYAGPMMRDRIIGALELCCRRGEMLLIQNKRVDWESHTIGIPGHTTKDRENRRIPFNPEGRLVEILERRKSLGPNAYVFGSECGEYQPNIQTAWDALRLLAYGIEPRRSRGRENAEWNRLQLRKIDLHWHDLRHEGASRLLADGVDIRIIQLMLGHASLQQTQRYLNVTDEELRRGLEVSWKRARVVQEEEPAKAPETPHDCHPFVTQPCEMWRARQDSNLWPSAPEADALSS
jgi:integrase